MGTKSTALDVFRRFLNEILPVKLWDGRNNYCAQPGREPPSEYAQDLASLKLSITAVELFVEKAEALRRNVDVSTINQSARSKAQWEKLVKDFDYALARVKS